MYIRYRVELSRIGASKLGIIAKTLAVKVTPETSSLLATVIDVEVAKIAASF